jgi:hypothetical protein
VPDVHAVRAGRTWEDRAFAGTAGLANYQDFCLINFDISSFNR